MFQLIKKQNKKQTFGDDLNGEKAKRKQDRSAPVWMFVAFGAINDVGFIHRPLKGTSKKREVIDTNPGGERRNPQPYLEPAAA